MASSSFVAKAAAKSASPLTARIGDPWEPRPFAFLRPLKGEHAQRPALYLQNRNQGSQLRRVPYVDTRRQAGGSAGIMGTIMVEADADGTGQRGVDQAISLPCWIAPREP